MKNPITAFKEWLNRRRSLRRLSTISEVFGNIEKLEKSGLLHWERRHRRLFIAEPLAVVMLAKGAEQWANFLNNIYQYVVYINLGEQWQNLIVVRQGKAVAEAKRTRPSLPADEIQRIRRAVIAELSEADIPLPKIQPFEFFVCADTKDKKPQTTLCGTYDPDTDLFDIVAWEEIQAAVASAKEKK